MVAELLADDVHAGDEPVVEDRRGGDAVVDGLRGELGDPLVLTPLQAVSDRASGSPLRHSSMLAIRSDRVVRGRRVAQRRRTS